MPAFVAVRNNSRLSELCKCSISLCRAERVICRVALFCGTKCVLLLYNAMRRCAHFLRRPLLLCAFQCLPLLASNIAHSHPNAVLFHANLHLPSLLAFVYCITDNKNLDSLSMQRVALPCSSQHLYYNVLFNGKVAFYRQVTCELIFKRPRYNASMGRSEHKTGFLTFHDAKVSLSCRFCCRMFPRDDI